MKQLKLTILILVCICCHLNSQAQSKPSMQFNHQAIYVANLQQSREFYSQVMGLDTIAEPFHDGKHVWFDVGRGGSLHIISGAEMKKEYYQNNHLCFSTNNLDQFKKSLEVKKITWYNAGGQIGKTTTRADGVMQVWVKDPDDYWLEINNDKISFKSK